MEAPPEKGLQEDKTRVSSVPRDSTRTVLWVPSAASALAGAPGVLVLSQPLFLLPLSQGPLCRGGPCATAHGARPKDPVVPGGCLWTDVGPGIGLGAFLPRVRLSSCCSSGRPLTVLETSLLQLLHDRVYFLSPEAEASRPESLLAAAAFSEQLWFLLYLPAVAQGPREGPAWSLPLHPPSLHGASTPG